MKIFKWLKRDRSGRRSSDVHPAMVTSPDAFCSTDSFECPVRTEDDKRALNEFFARRSLGPNTCLPSDKNERHRASDAFTTRCDPIERQVQSEKKPKRRSLPETRSTRTDSTATPQNVPQIQFLFSNQVFMPGSGASFNKRTKSDGKKSKDRHQQRARSERDEGSLISTSPDLLPPKFLRNRHVDFNTFGQTTPPDDFFRENSFPYEKTEMRTPENLLSNDGAFSRSDDKDIVDNGKTNSFGDWSPRSKGEDETDLDASAEDSFFGSMATKLEQISLIDDHPNYTNFRGIPLVNIAALQFETNDGILDNKWCRASWMQVPVCVKKNPKSWCSPGNRIPLDHFFARDLNVLTKIRHPNILLVMGMFYENANLNTFYEEATESLYEHIHEKGNVISCQAAVQYLKGIAKALYYMKNNNNIVHTNISSKTIMLSPMNVAKLCNFELCSEIAKRPKNKYKTSYHPYKLDFTPEPEYENLKDVNQKSKNEKESHKKDSLSPSECSPQEISSRSIFASFRWQAPELFDDYAGLVYPCTRTDVYSLCLVLWECCNNSIPWKKISYDQLCEFYFQMKLGIRLHDDNRYPPVIREILMSGLSLNPAKRIEISKLVEKFEEAENELLLLEELFILKDETEKKIESFIKSNVEQLFITSDDNTKDGNVDSSTKCEITDLDSDHRNSFKINLESSHANFYPEYYFTESKSNHVNVLSLAENDCLMGNISNSDIHETDSVNNTNSTEYQSILTPALKRCTSIINNETLCVPSSLSFEDESPKTHETSEKILKLSKAITPKSYKSLEIKTPDDEEIKVIRSLTRSFEQNKTKKENSYIFDIQSMTLPITPIARNNKIRRNVWLSGKENIKCIDNDPNNEDVILAPENQINAIDIDSNKLPLEINFNVQTILGNRKKRRHSLINIKYDSTSMESNMCKVSESERNGNAIQNNGFYRCRSQSLTDRPDGNSKSNETITGVDIKPLVAIHEKWILEARRRHERSSSLPDTYRSPSQAVKPASHLIDPLRPKNGMFDIDTKGKPKHGDRVNISPTVQHIITQLRTHKPRSSDFFENILWQKEKEICLAQINSKSNNPQGSSTPYSMKNSKNTSADKYTNTDTYEELLDKILENDKCRIILKNKINSYKTENIKSQRAESQNENTLPDFNFKTAKSSIISELANVFEKKTQNLNVHNDDTHVIESPVIKHLSNNFEVKDNKNEVDNALDNDYLIDFYEEGGSVHSEECCNLHIDNNTYNDDIINKALKRCQAFTALQDARSTEDMYIDDELTADMNIHEINENLQLLPYNVSLHEAHCIKGSECCLLKIKDEVECCRLLLFYENPLKNDRDSENSSFCNEADIEITTEVQQNNLQDEKLTMDNLIDLTTTVNRLPVIDEKSSEEDSEPEFTVDENKKDVEKTIIVKDLITLYENESKNNSSIIGKFQKTSNHKNKVLNEEISVFLLDDGEHNSQTFNKMQIANTIVDDIIPV